MDLLADDLELSPPALALLAAYDAAVKRAAADRRAAASAAVSADDAPPAGDGEAGGADSESQIEEAKSEEVESEEEEEDATAAATPARVPVAVPRLAPETVFDAERSEALEEDDGDAADLHGLLLAAGALDVDLSNVAAGVRYRVTRSGRGMLAKAA